MTNTQEQTKQMFKDVIDALEEATGLELCIAGGAVRDMVHDKPIKDLDIEVLNFSTFQRPLCEAKEIFGNIASRLEDLGAEDLQVVTSYEGQVSDFNVDVLLKAYLPTFNIGIDLILRSYYPTSPIEVISQYDMSLNQYYFHENNIGCSSFASCKKVVPLGKHISLKRLKHLYNKYPEYDFGAMLNFIE